jgi:hypothetical protein
VIGKQLWLLIVMVAANCAALLWLPAIVGFGCAAVLAVTWCWILDQRPVPEPASDQGIVLEARRAPVRAPALDIEMELPPAWLFVGLHGRGQVAPPDVGFPHRPR